MGVNDWWSGDPAERFWMVNEKWGEADDEAEIIHQQLNRNGSPSTFSRLCRFVNVGDIVVHYWTGKQAVLWWSQVTSAVAKAQLSSAFVTLNPASGFVPALTFNYRLVGRLDEPITLAQLREVEPELRSLRDDLLARHGNPIYFPWLFYGEQQRLNPAQMYLTKLPAAALRVLERLGNFQVGGA